MGSWKIIATARPRISRIASSLDAVGVGAIASIAAAAGKLVAATDYCATLPILICRHLARDPRLKVLPAPVDLGTFPLEMGWHVRYRDDPAHQWLRALVTGVAKETATSQAG